MTCPTGKIRYVTAAKAWRQVGIMRKRWHTQQACAYLCKKCDTYHLTHEMHHADRLLKQGRAA